MSPWSNTVMHIAYIQNADLHSSSSINVQITIGTYPNPDTSCQPVLPKYCHIQVESGFCNV